MLDIKDYFIGRSVKDKDIFVSFVEIMSQFIHSTKKMFTSVRTAIIVSIDHVSWEEIAQNAREQKKRKKRC